MIVNNTLIYIGMRLLVYFMECLVLH